ncbi:uncharacterized protein LOC110881430 [Helianthus annuus]|uniref:uncharacterized protein LOC110881430 n=1 Tax=Helianthus annuus TaxID=4232 RepID=UPI000B9064E5|nr:uncharacterized protein LOC110881430 [Helianthus annuus]
MCDNKAAIQISENPVQHDRTKHVEVDRHFIKEKLESGILELPFVRSEDQLADILTKAVNEKIFSKCLSKLIICQLYGKRYLRNLTWDDLQQIYEVYLEKHGIPGMIGGLDCWHWRWHNCPTAWRGQRTRGDQKGPTLVLQADASYDLWVWLVFFGIARCMNDINTFEFSPLLEGYILGTIPKAGFHANGNDYTHGYYLSDGIYPEYSNIVKTFSETLDIKRQHFKKLMWDKEKFRMVMYACIIIHNMILEDDGKTIWQNYFLDDENLVEHAWEICNIPQDGDHEEESEEEEDFEIGGFEDKGLDDGDHDEEEGNNGDEDG